MFKPLNSYVLLKKADLNEKELKIYIPNNDTQQYLVINIGKEVLETKVNDHVIVNEQKLKEVIYEGVLYFLIEEKDIYMIVEA